MSKKPTKHTAHHASTRSTESIEVNRVLSSNLSRLRQKRDLTFDALSKVSGVSKGTLVQIEQGVANPSIGTLCRLANVFAVPLSDLVEPDEVLSPMLTTDLQSATDLWQGAAGSSAKLLFGMSQEGVVEFWRWNLKPSHRHASEAHPKGTREIIHVVSGEVAVSAADEHFVIEANQAIQFSADVAHEYENTGQALADFVMVVIEPTT